MTGPPDRRGDAGQVMLLIVFYALIALSLVLVAIDAADVFLVQREMAATADGAALAAAQSADRAVLYSRGGCALPLSAPDAAAAADRYLSGRSPAVASAQVLVGPGGRTVTVRLFRRVVLPFHALLGAVYPRWSSGVPVLVSASARAPLLGAGC